MAQMKTVGHYIEGPRKPVLQEKQVFLVLKMKDRIGHVVTVSKCTAIKKNILPKKLQDLQLMYFL